MNKACCYEEVIGVTPIDDDCKHLHPNGCSDCSYYLDNRFDHKTLYSLKEVCDIAGISAEDLIKSDTPEIS